jgi:CBS domain-containing protein
MTPMRRFVDEVHHPVQAITAAATVRDCLTMLISRHFTGLPVTNGEGGDIVANVSLSDVRRLGSAHTATEFEALLDTNVLDYLRRKSADSAAPSLSPLVLHKDDSLGTAIELLASSKM